MTTYISSALLFSTLLSLVSCSNNSQETTEESQPPAQRTERVEATKDKLMENVVNEYLSIKNALVASEAETAHKGAVELLSMVDATKMPALQQRTKEMAAVENIDSLRVRFDSLSVALYEQVKESSYSSQTLYKQYCPMAFDNRGAFWLSSEEESKNPYFGDKMLNCGRVEEEISF